MKRLSVLLLCVLIALASFSATGCKGKYELDLPDEYTIEGEMRTSDDRWISFRYRASSDGYVEYSYGYKYSYGFEDMYIYAYIGGEGYREYKEYMLQRTIYGYAVYKETFMSEERLDERLAKYQGTFSKMYDLIENEGYTATEISRDELVEEDKLILNRLRNYGCEYYKLSKDGEDFYYEAAIDPDTNLTMYLAKIDAQKEQTHIVSISLYENSCDGDIKDILQNAMDVTYKYADEL